MKTIEEQLADALEEIKERDETISDLKRDLEHSQDEVDDLEDEVEKLEKEVKVLEEEIERVDNGEFSLTTPLGTITINTSGNFRHQDMVEDFLAMVKATA